MSDKTINIVIVCHFSNEELRNKLHFEKFYSINLIRKFLGYPLAGFEDKAIWNSNAIREIRKYDDIKLSVILPHYGIKGDLQSFDIRGVKYYCYRSQDDHILPFLKSKILKKSEKIFYKNRKIINSIISNIKPDIVHIIGAENPYYSMVALDIPRSIPTILSLQTLMSAPNFKDNYPLSAEIYNLRSEIERRVILKCRYIATDVLLFKKYIKEIINPNAIFLGMPLSVGVDIDISYTEKKFDFVYFASNIQKACDDAIEAFAILCQKYPNATLNVSGGYDALFKKKIDDRISKLKIVNNVFFTGSKNTHEEVLNQIKLSRFALLPLKVDLISSTIREAMACGLPVITTITEATPKLNIIRESVLLSEKGDYIGMAKNMQKLMEEKKYADLIRGNALETVKEKWSNEHYISIWHDTYWKVKRNEI